MTKRAEANRQKPWAICFCAPSLRALNPKLQTLLNPRPYTVNTIRARITGRIQTSSISYRLPRASSALEVPRPIGHVDAVAQRDVAAYPGVQVPGPAWAFGQAQSRGGEGSENSMLSEVVRGCGRRGFGFVSGAEHQADQLSAEDQRAAFSGPCSQW